MQADRARAVPGGASDESPVGLAGLSVHFVGEGGLLLDSARQRLYALNPSAALIWSCLKEGKPPADVASYLAEQLAVPSDEAAAYVATVLQQYRSLDRDHDASLPHAGGQAAASLAVNGLHSPRFNRDSAVETYFILGGEFRVHYESARLLESIHPLLHHMALATAAPTGHATDVVVASNGIGVEVRVGHDVMGVSYTQEDAAVAVRACLTQLAVSRTRGLCVVHAGALRRNGGALLLPGEAGSGKSTLSAGLVAQGFEMMCDDTTLLADAPPLVRCIPTGICIKRGAYDVLAPHYPKLRSLPEWRRPDGRHARYLAPDEGLRWAEPDATVRARWIVFPRYHPDQDTTLLPLPRHQAMARLLHGVCFLSGSLDERNLETLIAWIEDIDCFELPMSSLDKAAALLNELCQ
jgi:hypothetical protein